MTKIVKTATDIKINFNDGHIAIVSDLRSSYTSCGNHPEWRRQFINAINRPSYQEVLAKKLKKYGPFIICYTKIKPDREAVCATINSPDATVCVISSVGEHNMTPWMIIHNIGHTILSWNFWVKKDIKKILGLEGQKYRIAPKQKELVTCASSKDMIIPNLNELIYELFTTWVWHGKTMSDHVELASYCDVTFPVLMEKIKGTMFWHKYRCPTNHSDKSYPWLKDIVRWAGAQKKPLIPGIPGYSNKVLKIKNAE